MESISIHNYEAYFLDYLEGSLSAADEVALYAFLDANPQLKSEFIDLTGMAIEDLRLTVDESESISTSSLKADPSVLSAMTVDQWMVSSVENDLTNSQNAQLLTYVSQHKLEHKFMAYQATILSPQPADVYGDKSGLKRKPATVIPMWMKVGSAAAAIALIVFLVQPGEAETNLAEENPSNTINAQTMDFRNFYTELPRAIELKSNVNQKQDLELIQYDDNNIVRVEKIEQIKKVDSSIQVIPEIVLPDDIVEQKLIDSVKTNKNNPDIVIEEENIAVIDQPVNKTVEEEPYRLFTEAASNVTNRTVSFKRTLNTDSDEYVAYHFKIGKFEFDRKKRSK